MEKKEQTNLAIYQSEDGKIQVAITLEKETLWLNQKDIAVIFGIQRPAITKHLWNIFREKELDEKSVSSILEHTANDGKTYKTTFYSLDAIIAVWYRVNSAKATKFRIRATGILKDYLIKWFALNQKRLEETKIQELEQDVSLIKKNIEHKWLSHKETTWLLNVITHYTYSQFLSQSLTCKIPKNTYT